MSLKELFVKVNFEKVSRRQQAHEKLPSIQRDMRKWADVELMLHYKIVAFNILIHSPKAGDNALIGKASV